MRGGKIGSIVEVDGGTTWHLHFTTLEAIENMSAGEGSYWSAWMFWANGMGDQFDGDYLQTFVDIEYDPDTYDPNVSPEFGRDPEDEDLFYDA